MKILAIEAATDICSVALLVDGTIEQTLHAAPREQAKVLLPMIDSLMADAELTVTRLDAVAFGRGPGSFTGLRIAAGVTQGIAFAADLAVMPVSTLAALAQGSVREHGQTQILAALDARMQEIYWGAYAVEDSGLVQLQGDEHVCSPTNIIRPENQGWAGAGSGWQTYSDVLRDCCAGRVNDTFPEQRPQAMDVAQLGAAGVSAGRAVGPEQAIPVYLRDNVASKPGLVKPA